METWQIIMYVGRCRAAGALFQAAQRSAEQGRVAAALRVVVSCSRYSSARPPCCWPRLPARRASDAGQPLRHAGHADRRSRRGRSPAPAARRWRAIARMPAAAAGAQRSAARQSSNLSTLEAAHPGLQTALLRAGDRSRPRSSISTWRPPIARPGVRDKAFDYLSEALRHDPTERRAARRTGPRLARLGLARSRPVRRASGRLLRAAVGRGAQHAGHGAVGAGPAAGGPPGVRGRGRARPARLVRLAATCARWRWPRAAPRKPRCYCRRAAALREAAQREDHAMKAEASAAAAALMPAGAAHAWKRAGLTFDQVLQLVLKLLHLAGELSGAELGERLGLQLLGARAGPPPPALDLSLRGARRRTGRRPVLHLSDHRRRPRPGHAVPRAEPLRRRGAGAVSPVRAVHAGLRRAVDAAAGHAGPGAAGAVAPGAERPGARPARPGGQRRALAVRLRPAGQRQDGHRPGRQEPARRRHRHPLRHRPGRPPRAGLRPGRPRGAASAGRPRISTPATSPTAAGCAAAGRSSRSAASW